MVANGDLETPKSTVELKFEVGDIEFHEIFIVMEKMSHNWTDVPAEEPHRPGHAPRYTQFPLLLDATKNGRPQVFQCNGANSQP